MEVLQPENLQKKKDIWVASKKYYEDEGKSHIEY